jgi:hypothetical protein
MAIPERSASGRIGVIACAALGVVGLMSPAISGHSQSPHKGVNLGVCNEQKTSRPRIEGLDICVRNLGDSEGQGAVFVELLDSAGSVLLRVDQDAGRGLVRIPPYRLGGKEGTVVRINPTLDFLAIVETLESRARHYSIRGTIETLGRDADPSDNARVKEFNSASKVVPAEARELRYAFRNHDAQVRHVRLVMHRVSSPIEWSVEGAPSESAAFEWSPGHRARSCAEPLRCDLQLVYRRVVSPRYASQ